MRSDHEFLSMGIACDWGDEPRESIGESWHGHAHQIVVIARDVNNGEALEAYLCHACVDALGITVRECSECASEV